MDTANYIHVRDNNVLIEKIAEKFRDYEVKPLNNNMRVYSNSENWVIRVYDEKNGKSCVAILSSGGRLVLEDICKKLELNFGNFEIGEW